MEQSGRDPSTSPLSLSMRVSLLFPSIALQITVEFPNDGDPGHCSNIYISSIMFECDVQGASLPLLFQAVADGQFCCPKILLTMDFRCLFGCR